MEKETSTRYRSRFWVWFCLLSLCARAGALELGDLFEFGEEAGDQQLPPGSDSSAELPLNGSLFFFGETVDRLHGFNADTSTHL
ncbi:hypothetical protein EYF80_029227 [Liparis tanakae]|uniref:Uncharacterized protein n=1 Tax=Liparis tanakae TaxID=230148 RepID=A0A4Z2H6R7_9TELE|nr:hypothetical protein EYF80_029227 [Liparis tanakae]